MKKRMLVLAVVAVWMSACGSSGGSDGDTQGPGPDSHVDGALDQNADVTLPPDVTVDGTEPLDLNVPDKQEPDGIPDNWIPPNPDVDQVDPGEVDVPDYDTELVVPDEFAIELVSPDDGATLTGSVLVRVIPKGVEEQKVDWVRVMLDDQQIFQDTKLPTEFVLDTTRHKLPGFTLTAKGKIGPKTAEDAVTVTLNNPTWSLKRVYAEEYRYKNGDEVSLFVETGLPGMVLTADFGALDSDYVVGDERSTRSVVVST